MQLISKWPLPMANWRYSSVVHMVQLGQTPSLSLYPNSSATTVGAFWFPPSLYLQFMLLYKMARERPRGRLRNSGTHTSTLPKLWSWPYSMPCDEASNLLRAPAHPLRQRWGCLHVHNRQQPRLRPHTNWLCVGGLHCPGLNGHAQGEVSWKWRHYPQGNQEHLFYHPPPQHWT